MAYTSERFGELLVRAELITQQQLDVALDSQSRDGGKLGEVLVRELVLTEDQIAETLASQKGLEHVNLAATAIDSAAATLIPLRMARKRAVVPIAIDGAKLTLAMADPLDIEAIDEVEFASGLEVHPVVAAASQVRYAIEKYIAGTGVMQELDVAEERELLGVDVSGGLADLDVPVVRVVSQIIREAIAERASDIHFEPRNDVVVVRVRIDGVLREAARIPKGSQAELLSRLKVMADLDITERRRPQDGRVTVSVDAHPLDVRIATLPTPLGEAITLRLLDESVAFRPVGELGLSDRDRQTLLGMLRRPYGAFFVSGPTGSGKSTTLYSLLREIQSEETKIITVEDPIEYRMDGVTQLAVNPRAGLTFATGLRTILRSDPDIVMVGEVRDPETAEIAVRAALTGHLVLSSIHTNDAPSALTRLNDMGVPPYITSSGLIGAMAQRLVRRLCPHCRQPMHAPEQRLANMGVGPEGIEAFEVFGPVGCDRCSQTGYRGRVGVFEVMEYDDELAGLYLANAPVTELREAAIARGMRPLLVDALEKVAAGMTSLEEVERVIV